MTKLAETYIHLKLDASEKFKTDSEEYLQHLSRFIAAEIFAQETEVYIRFEDGSWKTWITIAGAIYIGIGQYGSFRSGIEYLTKDSRKFSNTVIEHFVEKQELNQDLIFRTERRLCVPGKIHRLFQRIDNLQHYFPKSGREYPWGDSNIDRDHLDNELKKIKSEIINIFKLLDHEKDRSFFVKSLNLKLADDLLAPQKITIKQLPDIKLDYKKINLINKYPVTSTPLIPFNGNIYSRDEVAIKEEDEVDKLKRIIESSRFDIDLV